MDESLSFDLESSQKESDAIEFKSQFDTTSKQEWCELIKDIVAIANTGGGVIIFGVNNDGTPSVSSVNSVLEIDPADITNKIYSYTDQQFSSFALLRRTRGGADVAILKIGPNRIPVVFSAPGTYAVSSTVQKSAFSKGAVYFRHGGKSEPGTTDDFRAAIERELGVVKEFWMQGIAKVVTAPPGAVVQVIKQDVTLRDSEGSSPVRLTNAPDAPAFRAIQSDQLYPYRQKELFNTINDRIGEKVVGQYDMLCVRHEFKIDENPTYSYKSQWSPRQYSDACLEWIISEYGKDKEFFRKAKDNLLKKGQELF